MADGNWHHVAATWEDDGVSANVVDVRLWVDGVLQGVGGAQGQAIDTANGDDVRIGVGQGGRYFDGQIDEVRIYNHAIDRSEVRAVAGLAADGYYDAVQVDDPIACCALGETSGGKVFNEGSLGSVVDLNYTGSPTQGVQGLLANAQTPLSTSTA